MKYRLACIVLLILIVSASFAQTYEQKALNIPCNMDPKIAPCSIFGSIVCVMKSLGVQTDYTDLMGHSGAAFRLVIDSNWELGAMDVYFKNDFLKMGLTAYGYAYEQAPEEGSLFYEYITKTIEAGIPAIAVIGGTGQFGIVSGYVPASKEIIARKD